MKNTHRDSTADKHTSRRRCRTRTRVRTAYACVCVCVCSGRGVRAGRTGGRGGAAAPTITAAPSARRRPTGHAGEQGGGFMVAQHVPAGQRGRAAQVQVDGARREEARGGGGVKAASIRPDGGWSARVSEHKEKWGCLSSPFLILLSLITRTRADKGARVCARACASPISSPFLTRPRSCSPS